MAWFGPRGNCGCCAGECSCFLQCQCSNDGSFYRSYTTTLSNFPAAYSHVTTSGGFTKRHTFYGLEQINGSYTFGYNAKIGDVDCLPDAAGLINPILYSGSLVMETGTNDGIDVCNGNYTSSQSMQTIIRLQVIGTYWAFDVLNAEGEPSFGTLFAQSSGPSGAPTCSVPKYDCNIGTFFSHTTNLRNWNPGSAGVFGMFPFVCPGPDVFVDVSYCVNYSDGGRLSITGWRYIVSDIPQFVDVRAFGTTVYRVEGLDSFNGTYDVARREDLDCAAGIQQFQLNLTAEQYDITTSTPCLETPVPGGTKNVLATLTIPPSQSSKRILGLVIDGVGTFGYDLSDDWDSYACGPQTETLTESDPCLVHTGDWLTIESSALLE